MREHVDAADQGDDRERREEVRARVVRGMHLLEPTEGGGSTYTFTQQIDSGGARVPACMLQRSSSLFVERLARTAVSV